MKKVAILGCGPAGLLTAHAAYLNGCDVQIFSRRIPSSLYGCQYLHQPIPEIHDEDSYGSVVKYTLDGGDLFDYRRKVYGESWQGEVSPGSLEGNHMAWDIRQAYLQLWRLYWDYIDDIEIRSESQITKDAKLNRYDLVISTVPRKIWAQPGDQFLSTKIWAVGDAPELRQQAPFKPSEDFTVVCDASNDVGWYRMSRVFDHTTIEWPGTRPKPPVPGVVEVHKPLGHNSQSAKDFVHLGRYGAWQKGQLTTDAFNIALEMTK